MALMEKKHNSTVRRRQTILLEVAMKNIGAAVIIKYCTGVIWHDLHGAHYSPSDDGGQLCFV